MARLKYVDICRGWCIVLMIIGHTVDGVLRTFIYSFHMPLFFILSGYTTRYSESLQDCKKSAKRLALYTLRILLLVWGVQSIYELFVNLGEYESVWECVKVQVYRLLLSSSQNTDIGGLTIPHISPIWFVVCLFFARVMYDAMHLRLQGGVRFIGALIIGIIGILIGQWFVLPYSFDIALAVVPFLWFGDYMKGKNVFSFKAFILSIAVFSISFVVIAKATHTGMELVARRYSLFPLCYFGTCAATVALIAVAKYVENKFSARLVRIMCLAGEFSLTILIVHVFDIYYKFLFKTDNMYLTSAMRVGVVLAIAALCIYVKRQFVKSNIYPLRIAYKGKNM